MFDNLTKRFNSVVKTLRGQARLTEDNIQQALRDVRIALLEADVGLPVVKEFMANVQGRAIGQEVAQSLTPGQAVVQIVAEELTRLMGESQSDLNLAVRPPAILLMAGLQGAGKTTTSAKLAKFLSEQTNKKVLLASCDVYRPAAMAQLQSLALQIGVDYFVAQQGASPMAIAEAALDYARRHFHDVLIVDTAGRLGIDEAMMQEISALNTALTPAEVLFVVDAMQGQDAVNTAKAFAGALPLTGIILTKLDGDARGGAALSARQITGKPIKFVGISEKLHGLEPFYPERMASRILGMGDVLSLIEDAQRNVDQEDAKKLAKKLKSGKDFTLDDFKTQLLQMKKMGGMTALLDKLPAQLSNINAPQMGDKEINHVEAIINSMTLQERTTPVVIKASRKRRIALGSGTSVQEVNRLLNQFEQAQKLMKMMSKGGMAKMMRGMKSMIPPMR